MQYQKALDLSLRFQKKYHPNKFVVIHRFLMAFIKYGKDDYAEILLQNMVESNWDKILIDLVRMSIYASTSRIEEYYELREKYPNVDSLAVDAQLLYPHHQSELAVKYAERHSKSHPQDIANLELLLHGYQNYVVKKKAFNLANKILKLDKSNKSALYCLAKILIKREDFSGARKILDTSAKYYPSDPEIQFLKAASYYFNDEFRPALSHISKAAKIILRIEDSLDELPFQIHLLKFACEVRLPKIYFDLRKSWQDLKNALIAANRITIRFNIRDGFFRLLDKGSDDHKKNFCERSLIYDIYGHEIGDKWNINLPENNFTTRLFESPRTSIRHALKTSENGSNSQFSRGVIKQVTPEKYEFTKFNTLIIDENVDFSLKTRSGEAKIQLHSDEYDTSVLLKITGEPFTLLYFLAKEREWVINSSETKYRPWLLNPMQHEKVIFNAFELIHFDLAYHLLIIEEKFSSEFREYTQGFQDKKLHEQRHKFYRKYVKKWPFDKKNKIRKRHIFTINELVRKGVNGEYTILLREHPQYKGKGGIYSLFDTISEVKFIPAEKLPLF